MLLIWLCCTEFLLRGAGRLDNVSDPVVVEAKAMLLAILWDMSFTEIILETSNVINQILKVDLSLVDPLILLIIKKRVLTLELVLFPLHLGKVIK